MDLSLLTLKATIEIGVINSIIVNCTIKCLLFFEFRSPVIDFTGE